MCNLRGLSHRGHQVLAASVSAEVCGSLSGDNGWYYNDRICGRWKYRATLSCHLEGSLIRIWFERLRSIEGGVGLRLRLRSLKLGDPMPGLHHCTTQQRHTALLGSYSFGQSNSIWASWAPTKSLATSLAAGRSRRKAVGFSM